MGISMLKKINSKYIETLFETDSQYSEWFGYYNYDVINSDATKMLCNRVDFDGRAITNTDIVELGYYDLANGIILQCQTHSIGNKVRCYNGCRIIKTK